MSQFSFDSLCKHSVLSRDEEIALANIIRGDGTESRKKRAVESLILHNVKLASKIARDFSFVQGADIEDLQSEAVIGLHEAAVRFDPSRGAGFATYASFWIRQRVQRYLSNHGRTIRVPVHRLSDQRRLIKIRSSLAVELGRDPTLAEMAEATGIRESKLDRILNTGFSMVPLDAPISDDGASSTFGDLIADPNAADPSGVIEAGDDSARLFDLLPFLADRERNILIQRFGLDGSDPKTLETVGASMSLTRERIRQIEAIALKKLRSLFKKKVIPQPPLVTATDIYPPKKYRTLRDHRHHHDSRKVLEVLRKYPDGCHLNTIAAETGFSKYRLHLLVYRRKHNALVVSESLKNGYYRIKSNAPIIPTTQWQVIVQALKDNPYGVSLRRLSRITKIHHELLSASLGLACRGHVFSYRNLYFPKGADIKAHDAIPLSRRDLIWDRIIFVINQHPNGIHRKDIISLSGLSASSVKNFLLTTNISRFPEVEKISTGWYRPRQDTAVAPTTVEAKVLAVFTNHDEPMSLSQVATYAGESNHRVRSILRNHHKYSQFRKVGRLGMTGIIYQSNQDPVLTGTDKAVIEYFSTHTEPRTRNEIASQLNIKIKHLNHFMRHNNNGLIFKYVWHGKYCGVTGSTPSSSAPSL